MPAATIVRADHPSYYKWHAAAARGKATILGYAYAKDGCRMIAATTWVQRTRQNPLPVGQRIAVPVGKKFFTDALLEYNDLVSRCWFREAIQNSVDAKAKNIDITTKDLPDGRFEVTVSDDGTGMSENILYTKFLIPGVSGKEGEVDSTGGFGDAKRILFWPWCQYTVFTNGSDGPLGIQGEGWEMVAIEGLQATGKGTKIAVIMPSQQHVDAIDAIWFIQRCNLPRVRFTVNGEVVKADLKVGKEIDAGNMADDLDLYHSPRSDLNAFIIRKNGILMFEVPADPGIVKGAIIGELTKPSLEALAKNRNELKTRAWRPGSFVQQLAQDRASKIKTKKSKQERTRYEGSSRVRSEVKNTTGKLYDTLAKHFNDAGNAKLASSMAEELELMVGALPKAEDAGVFMPTPGIARIIATGMHDTIQSEAAAQQLAWAADFFIINETEEYKVPSWLRPDGMEAHPRKVARLWLEFCRLILIRLGYKGEFGIGWIFSTSDAEKSGYTQAAFLTEGGMPWLLLNPFIGGNIKEEKVYSIREPYHLNSLFALAMHECTHLVNRVSYHNEEFTSALTENIAKVLPSAKLMLAVRDAVAAIKDKAEKKEKKSSNEYVSDLEGLVKEIVDRADKIDTSADALSSCKEVIKATTGWDKLNEEGRIWLKNIGLTNQYTSFSNHVGQILDHFKGQGLQRFAAVRKIVETVPKEIIPAMLTFNELRDIVAYQVWQVYA